MGTLLIKNVALLATMDDERNEIPDGGIFIRDGVIQEIGEMAQLPLSADQVIDLTDHLVLPGLINTHHHLYQTLTRAYATEADLFTWLRTLYPVWAGLTDEAIYISTLTGLAELALSGSFPMTARWTARFGRPARLVCASMLPGDRCRWVRARAVCRLTASRRMRHSSSRTASA